MIKRLGVVFVVYIQEMFSEVWNAGAVPRDRANEVHSMSIYTSNSLVHCGSTNAIVFVFLQEEGHHFEGGPVT